MHRLKPHTDTPSRPSAIRLGALLLIRWPVGQKKQQNTLKVLLGVPSITLVQTRTVQKLLGR